ncbi:unnamed protein product [Dovyalis caffra]|uniref:Uncharacterized protein n=1 Tax=Dovyalis caffra TaxID=77055 RepID=A0AAV1RHP9_9ROSI|nr:unnamed protein product [Dovyalis caffra]
MVVEKVVGCYKRVVVGRLVKIYVELSDDWCYWEKMKSGGGLWTRTIKMILCSIGRRLARRLKIKMVGDGCSGFWQKNEADLDIVVGCGLQDVEEGLVLVVVGLVREDDGDSGLRHG